MPVAAAFARSGAQDGRLTPCLIFVLKLETPNSESSPQIHLVLRLGLPCPSNHSFNCLILVLRELISAFEAKIQHVLVRIWSGANA